ncbi:DUF1289 domain-containing protein [Haloquadratum walsbyi]|nr:DUF1289 domain-containing protein [Haloquadratum walsbyi]
MIPDSMKEDIRGVDSGKMNSPCIGVCNIDESKEVCSNCGRTLDQIAIWTGMTPSERQEIIEELKEMGYPKPDA